MVLPTLGIEEAVVLRRYVKKVTFEGCLHRVRFGLVTHSLLCLFSLSLAMTQSDQEHRYVNKNILYNLMLQIQRQGRATRLWQTLTSVPLLQAFSGTGSVTQCK